MVCEAFDGSEPSEDLSLTRDMDNSILTNEDATKRRHVDHLNATNDMNSYSKLTGSTRDACTATAPGPPAWLPWPACLAAVARPRTRASPTLPVPTCPALAPRTPPPLPSLPAPPVLAPLPTWPPPFFPAPRAVAAPPPRPASFLPTRPDAAPQPPRPLPSLPAPPGATPPPLRPLPSLPAPPGARPRRLSGHRPPCVRLPSRRCSLPSRYPHYLRLPLRRGSSSDLRGCATLASFGTASITTRVVRSAMPLILCASWAHRMDGCVLALAAAQKPIAEKNEYPRTCEVDGPHTLKNSCAIHSWYPPQASHHADVLA